MNKQRYDKLAEELNPLTIEIAKVNSKLGRGPPEEERQPLSQQLGKLDDKRKGILATLAAMRQAEHEECETAREAAKAKVAKSRLERIAWLREPGHEPSCPECGSLGKLVENIQNPVIVGGLGDPNARVTFAYRCENPDIAKGNHRFWLNLDEIEEKKELRKKSSSAGAILKVVSKASTND